MASRAAPAAIRARPRSQNLADTLSPFPRVAWWRTEARGRAPVPDWGATGCFWGIVGANGEGGRLSGHRTRTGNCLAVS